MTGDAMTARRGKGVRRLIVDKNGRVRKVRIKRLKLFNSTRQNISPKGKRPLYVKVKKAREYAEEAKQAEQGKEAGEYIRTTAVIYLDYRKINKFFEVRVTVSSRKAFGVKEIEDMAALALARDGQEGLAAMLGSKGVRVKVGLSYESADGEEDVEVEGATGSNYAEAMKVK